MLQLRVSLSSYMMVVAECGYIAIATYIALLERKKKKETLAPPCQLRVYSQPASHTAAGAAILAA